MRKGRRRKSGPRGMGAIGELTDIEVTAGFKIAEVYGRFERSIGCRRIVASPSYEVGRGWDATGEEDEVAIAQSKAAARAFAAMQTEMRTATRPPISAGSP
jgi:hypothetical protein